MKIAIECKYEKVKQRGAREGKNRVLYSDEIEICGKKKKILMFPVDSL